MCNKCHNDCSCNKSAKAGENKKFLSIEVGKKYVEKGCPKEGIFTCMFVGLRQAVLRVQDREKTIDLWHGLRYISEMFEEYTEPQKAYFHELKPGDKFRWVRQRDAGPVVCQKLLVIGSSVDNWWNPNAEGTVWTNHNSKERNICNEVIHVLG